MRVRLKDILTQRELDEIRAFLADYPYPEVRGWAGAMLVGGLKSTAAWFLDYGGDLEPDQCLLLNLAGMISKKFPEAAKKLVDEEKRMEERAERRRAWLEGHDIPQSEL